ncbi:hypothetical protein PG997_000101 [Apiospora hydei]|uniref:Uncharacterized protein n=1 Tax=Apiospora hydei TaxID=1337664 RepID=A0ABR1X9U7_9PEZI
MNNSLRTDICQYACRYWVYHLEHSGTQLCDGDEVHNFLTRHFLHWLEALSLMNRVSESLEILATIRGLTSSLAKQLDAFFDDANRFILANGSVILVAPSQIYSSGLLFAPKQSGHSGSVYSVVFSHDSQLVASASSDHTVKL